MQPTHRSHRLWALCLFMTGAAAQPAVLTSMVRMPLMPVAAGGKLVLAYEVEISNTSSQDVSLMQFETFANGKSQPELSYDAVGLARNTKQIAPPITKEVRLLKPGTRAVIFCWMEFSDSSSLPHTIQHQITFKSGTRPDLTYRDVPSTVSEVSSLALGSPLGTGDWWAAIGPSNSSDHRRAQVRIDRDPAAPFAQRYAIDWVALCDGRMYNGKGSANSDYCGYGKDVLAVADGQVVSAKNGIPENKPGEGSRAVKITLETLLGNHLILDLGNHLYAVYAHLLPGSLQVKVGDHTRRGQVIARLGNSGNSDAPHLHFHVAQAPELDKVTSLQSEPYPYTFEKFEILGQYSGRAEFAPLPGSKRAQELVTDGEVVRFP